MAEAANKAEVEKKAQQPAAPGGAADLAAKETATKQADEAKK